MHGDLGIYTGNIVGRKANGFGNWVGIDGYSKGVEYFGDWKNNKMNGRCKRYREDGILSYDGEFYQNRRHG